VSLDAVSAEEYRQVKRVDGFAKACEGIRQLARDKACVGVGFLVTEQNYRRLRRLVLLAQELGASYCQFRPAILFDPSNPGQPAEQPVWIGELPRSLEGLGIRVAYDLDRFQQYYNWQGHGYDRCYWSGLQTVITADGRVWTCCNKRGMSGECLGDLREERFQDVWERRPIATVSDTCRVMCRGHLANKELHQLQQWRDRPHSAFI
jgi:MoaA/NifB/PqqE/SkfB family radical SAM enzyme